MKLESSNKVDTNRWELQIAISSEDFSKEVDKAYNKQKNKISIPGFRKGKAPRAFVEKYYGEQVFYEDAVNALYPEAIENAAKEAGIEIIDDKIDFDVVKMSKQDGLVFKVKVTVMPEVSVENYKGIEVKKREVGEITEEDIESELKSIREKHARLITVDDVPAQMGDTVRIDFSGSVDGEFFEGGTATDVALELGKKQFIDGFEEQVAGHKIGDEFDVCVKFPENYHVAKLANKDAVFKTKLNKIQRKELPDIDDEFVKDISEFDTLADFKDDLIKKLSTNKKRVAENETETELLDKFVELVKVELPEALVKNRIKRQIQDFEYNLKSQGISLKDYFKFTDSSEEKLNDSFRPQAIKSIKLDLGLKKVAELENISVSDEELEKEYKLIASEYKMTVEEIKNIVIEKDVKNSALKSRSLEVIRKNKVEK